MVKSPQIDQTTIERLTEPVAARTCKSIGMMPKMMPVVTMTKKIMLVVIMTMKIMLVVIMPKKIMIFLSSLKLTPVGDTNIPLPMMQPTIT